MCGIFFFDLRGRTPEEVERLRGDAHAYALEHRGPDASAVEESEVWKGNAAAASKPAPSGHVPPPAAKPAPQPVYETDF